MQYTFSSSMCSRHLFAIPQLPKVDSLMNQFRNRENELWIMLHQKYVVPFASVPCPCLYCRFFQYISSCRYYDKLCPLTPCVKSLIYCHHLCLVGRQVQKKRIQNVKGAEKRFCRSRNGCTWISSTALYLKCMRAGPFVGCHHFNMDQCVVVTLRTICHKSLDCF